jgi:sterol desaturase/sphingolipid hydroxylase (fatty acid hydroxylase superfamily)
MKTERGSRRAERRLRKLPGLVSGGVVFAAIVVVAIAERVRPLRRRREPQVPHVVRDVAMAALSTLATTALQAIILRPLTRRLESERLGFVGSVRLSRAGRVVAGVLLLDYTLWVWHWLNHRAPLLWRFHRVHHVDLDLDSATGARFHFGEMSISVLFRWLQFRLIGPDPLAISLWQTMLLASIFFHHSNTDLTEQLDRAVSRVFVTPRLHGIHHSIVRSETDSNFASLFTMWDMLHGLFRDDVPQDAITIGVPAYQSADDVTIARILSMPMLDTRDDWVSQASPALPNPDAPSPAPR